MSIRAFVSCHGSDCSDLLRCASPASAHGKPKWCTRRNCNGPTRVTLLLCHCFGGGDCAARRNSQNPVAGAIWNFVPPIVLQTTKCRIL
eukprot:scaffold25445_cov183-Amphora_coffeaeformis.AAC.5